MAESESSRYAREIRRRHYWSPLDLGPQDDNRARDVELKFSPRASPNPAVHSARRREVLKALA